MNHSINCHMRDSKLALERLGARFKVDVQREATDIDGFRVTAFSNENRVG